MWPLFKVLILFMKFGSNELFLIKKHYTRGLVSLRLNSRQIIHTLNNRRTFDESELEPFLNENNFVRDKKIISISPAGYKGFYVMGVCKYIKQNYNLDDYIFTGASAGAWNSLLLCFKRDIEEIQNCVIEDSLQKTGSINELENLIKNKILTSYKTEDFDLRRLFIGVTTIDKYKSNTTIFSGFDNLEDALNCCVASSHIPFVSGGFKHIYRNLLTFDGGFSKFPYLNTTKSVLHITPNMWREPYGVPSAKFNITDYTTLFSKEQFLFNEMVENGYKDTVKNSDKLAAIMQLKN